MGDKGATGIKGDAGNQGTAGTKGDAGDKGATGIKGDVGDQGTTGVKGDVGDKGATGAGTKGDVGDKGATGTKGDAGDKGATGAGTKGDTGDKGATGTKGDVGDQGFQGATGPQGIGEKGETGQKGEPGSGGSGGSGVTAYLCKVEFDINNKATTTGTFVDPNSNGKYTTSGASYTRSISGSQYNGLFSFSNEDAAPISIVAYGFDNAGGAGSTPRYAITHLDFGGTNNQYEITGITPSAQGGGVVDTDLFTSFSSATIKIDLNNTYFELLSRPGFPAASLGHIYFVFTFN